MSVKTWYNRIIVCCVDYEIHLKVSLIYFVFDHKLAFTDNLNDNDSKYVIPHK